MPVPDWVTAAPAVSVTAPVPVLMPAAPFTVAIWNPLVSVKLALWLAVVSANVATLFAATVSVMVPVPLVDARRPEAEISWLWVSAPLTPAVRLVTPEVVRPTVVTVPTANASVST